MSNHNAELIAKVEELKSKRVIKKDNDIATATGYSPSVVSNYLSGRVKASENFIEKFEEVYATKLFENFFLQEPAVPLDKAPDNTAIAKLAESNRVLAVAQQDAITAAREAVAGNRILIDANSRLVDMLADSQKKTSTESDLRESLIGANAMLEVLQGLLLEDGVGKHWQTVDEGVAKLNKRIAEAVRNNKAKGTHDGAHIQHKGGSFS